MRIAEGALPGVEVVNLAEAGTDLDAYFGNLLRFGDRLDPDVVVVGLYLGNDLEPETPPLDTEEGKALALKPPPPPAEGLGRRIAKRSILLNSAFRLGKVYFPSLRSSFFQGMLDHLKEPEAHPQDDEHDDRPHLQGLQAEGNAAAILGYRHDNFSSDHIAPL